MNDSESVSIGQKMGRMMYRSSITTNQGGIDMVRVPTNRAPTHPGEMLLEEFIRPMNLTQQDVARAIRVPYQRINELVHGRRGITPATALRLSRFFGNTAAFWMNLQLRWDLYRAQLEEAEELKKIRPMQAMG